MMVSILIKTTVCALDILVVDRVDIVFKISNGEGLTFGCRSIHKVQVCVSIS